MAMKPKEREKWEKIRSKGRLHFALLYGAVAWGVTAGVSFAIAKTLVSGGRLGSAEFLAEALVAVPVFCVGGLVWGTWIWRTTEKKFLESGDTKPEVRGHK